MSKIKLDEVMEEVIPVYNGITDELESYELTKEQYKWFLLEAATKEGLLERVKELEKEVHHWKSCTDSEQKIAGRLQKKVEELEKLSKNLNHELFSARTERDKYKEEVQALRKSVDFLEKQRERMGNDHQRTIKDAGQLLIENQRYKQALEFYALKGNYRYSPIDDDIPPVNVDGGEKARQSLQGDSNA